MNSRSEEFSMKPKELPKEIPDAVLKIV